MTLESLAEIVLDPGISPLLVYAVVFLSCILESFFPPWPTDVIALYAGFLAGRGILDASTVFTLAVLGTQIGVMAAFWMTRRWGRVILSGRMARYLPTERLAQLERWFIYYGAPAIAVSRFFPGVRALVTPAAGLARFATWKVWVYAGLSILVWNVVVVGLGLVAGTHLDEAKRILVHYNVVAGIFVAVAGAGLVLLVLYRRFARP